MSPSFFLEQNPIMVNSVWIDDVKQKSRNPEGLGLRDFSTEEKT